MIKPTENTTKLIGVDACFAKGRVACIFWVSPILKSEMGKTNHPLKSDLLTLSL